jgi:FixJ family two-component response regulator
MASPKATNHPARRATDSLAAVPTVYIVTSNRAMRTSLQGLVSGLGYAAKSFRDAESFLSQLRPRPHSCLLLDLDLPGMSGLELLERLREIPAELPVITIGESYDVSLAVAAMQRGAVDYFEKPFVDHALRTRLEETIL